MTSHLPVKQQGDHDGDLCAWWTDCSASCDFCICLDDHNESGVSLNLTYGETKKLYHILQQKLKGVTFYDE